MTLNKDEIDGISKAAAEILKATPVYQDAVQPVAQEVGKSLKTLGGVINVALSPLEMMVFGLDKIKEELKERLEKRLSKIPPENIVTPQLQVVGPLLEKYKFIYDNEELSEMFINLLANAMDKNSVQKAHPSFVNVISELSPDEARLIRTIAAEHVLPKLDVNITAKSAPNSGYVTIRENFTLLGEKAELLYPDLTPSYLSNLERLRIISCTSGGMQESYSHKDYYVPLKGHKIIKELEEQLKEDNEVAIVEGLIRITEFGKMFIQAVV